ncbi:MAG TPA: homoserine dehydrogenase [Candidatus Acidoferrales bacterium]|nr:homoserine dehydrogenase [Candidatus Acidoferrales bacterium]
MSNTGVNMAASANVAESPVITRGTPLKVALAGFGTVGSAVAKILCSSQPDSKLQLTHVYNRAVARKRVSWAPAELCWTERIEEVLESDADVLVELVGGLKPAYDWVRAALESGKHVVTANKQLIAQHGPELAELAHRCKRTLAFGASVAGGVPVLDALQEGLAGDRLFRVCGVLNGTCNYILTKIEREGTPFDQALAEAQTAGFAEADPTDDVDGFDARAKLVILSRVGLNVVVRPEEILCESIRSIGPVDFTYSHDLGCTVRQISRAELHDGRYRAAVQPALVPLDNPLAELVGGQNLVISTGEFGGDTVFSGHGAGGNPTAVAVVSDLLGIARLHPHNGQNGEWMSPPRYSAHADFVTPWYLRFVVKDKPGIVAALAHVLAKHEINIDALLQKPGYDKSALPFVITLEACSASKVKAALAEIEQLDFLVQKPLSLPILS